MTPSKFLFFLWNGQCKSPVLIGFVFKDRLDLSDPKCHCQLGTKNVGSSPKGLASRADEALIKQSILDPIARITEGFPVAMPSFAGVLSEQELADLLAYLATLR